MFMAQAKHPKSIGSRQLSRHCRGSTVSEVSRSLIRDKRRSGARFVRASASLHRLGHQNLTPPHRPQKIDFQKPIWPRVPGCRFSSPLDKFGDVGLGAKLSLTRAWPIFLRIWGLELGPDLLTWWAVSLASWESNAMPTPQLWHYYCASSTAVRALTSRGGGSWCSSSSNEGGARSASGIKCKAQS